MLKSDTDMPVPSRPKLYHITHGANLQAIIAAGGLLADSEAVQGAAPTRIGMPEVVARRRQLPVPCHPPTCVGEYVPFYFCPRSVMLYVISRRNHQGLTYTGGQRPIVHLEADLRRIVEWADDQQVPWAFTLSNAAEIHAEFRCRLGDLGEVNWAAVRAQQWSGPWKAPKQAEFLVHGYVPWSLIERIGVMDDQVAQRVSGITAGSTTVRVEVRPAWYYQDQAWNPSQSGT